MRRHIQATYAPGSPRRGTEACLPTGLLNQDVSILPGREPPVS